MPDQDVLAYHGLMQMCSMGFLDWVLVDRADLLDHGPGIYGACMTCFWVIYMTWLWHVAVLAHCIAMHT